MKRNWINIGILLGLVVSLITPLSSAANFSGTLVAEYDNNWIPGITDLPMSQLQAQYNRVYYYLHDIAGWSQYFLKTDAYVTETTFRTSVDYSNFHYHCGHGVYDWTSDGVTEVCLKDWNLWRNAGDVRPQDINYQWDYQLKWIWLHSCHILEDDRNPLNPNNFRTQWAQYGLNKCHMILGFASVVTLNTPVVNSFFVYSVNQDKTVVTSYSLATKAAYGSDVKAAILVDTLA